MRYKYIVSIHKDALTALILNGLESFLLPDLNLGKRKHPEQAVGHEIDGYIFGTRKREKKFLRYDINFINVNTTSKTHQKWVKPGTDTLALKSMAHKVLYPRARLLGDFHTHPYRLYINEGEMLSTHFSPGMYQPSPKDEMFGGEEFQLDLIMAIVNARRSLSHKTCHVTTCDGDTSCYLDCVTCSNDEIKYCIQFDIGIFRFFLAAYVRQGEAENFTYAPFCYTNLLIPQFLQWRRPRKLDFSSMPHLLENLSRTSNWIKVT